MESKEVISAPLLVPDRLLVLEGLTLTFCAVASENAVFSLDVFGDRIPVGSIILGRLETLNHDLGTAFVDIGEDRPALLHLKDLPKSKKTIKSGDSLVLQVFRSKTEHKGARVTGKVEFKSPNMVFLPNDEGIHVSRKMSNALQQKLKTHFEHIVERDGIQGGVLLRTSAGQVEPELLEGELAASVAAHMRMSSECEYKIAPQVLEKPHWPDWMMEMLKDNSDIRMVMTNSKRVLEVLKEARRSLVKEGHSIDMVLEAMPCMPDYSGMTDWLMRLAEHRHPLECGGEIVIESTEAMTVVDVNGPVGKGAAVTARVNREAIASAFSWLQSTRTSGITILDLIGCETQKERDALFSYAKQVATCYEGLVVHDVTKLGLMEITTQNTGTDLFRMTGGRQFTDAIWLINYAAASMSPDARFGSDLSLMVPSSVFDWISTHRKNIEKIQKASQICEDLRILDHPKKDAVIRPQPSGAHKAVSHAGRRRSLWVVETPEREVFRTSAGKIESGEKKMLEITWESDNYIDA